MVENSLQSMLDKYSFFFNKNEGSNFYKVVDVNNENFKLLYNSLFQVYESFHLNKRLLVWKEQSVPYDYRIHFVCNYPNIKSVNILKNDTLIYTNSYERSENKTNFQFTYICNYTTSNNSLVNAYKCTSCGEIYFDTTTPLICTNCNHENLEQINIYQCNNCNEIYLGNTEEPCTHCNNNEFTQLQAYYCNNCNEIYLSETVLSECPNCQTPYTSRPNRTLYYDEDNININDNSINLNETNETEDTIIDTIILNPPEPETESERFINSADDVESTPENPYHIPIPIIPDDKFLITVETYDEYIVSKGFPENDTPTYDSNGRLIGDPFDHDYSLDQYGKLNQIPRKQYIEVTNPELYHLTEPPYNNRGTEDDYHYMKRILEYNLRLWDTPAPVLEIWKLYGLPATLLNRERLLVRMFDENKHEFDKETGLVGCWKPQVWEHKDRFCDGGGSLGEYFFAEADTIRPTIWQNVTIKFRLLNSFAEEIIDDYLVDIYYYLEDEHDNVKLLKADYSMDTAVISYKVFESNLDKSHVLRFVAHKNDDTVIGTEEIIINIRNCDDGDWYVSSTGDDVLGDGSRDNPFQTLNKAISVVSNARDLIVVSGDLTLSDENSIPVVNTNCTILGCDDVSITSNYHRRFFHLVGSHNITLHLVNLLLKTSEVSTSIKFVDFKNTNSNFYDYETVIINGGLAVLEADINTDSYYPFDYIHVNGSLKSKEEVPLTNKNLTLKLNDTSFATITTDDNGEFNEWVNINSEYSEDTQVLSLVFDHTDYFETTKEWNITYKEPEYLRVRIGESIELTSSGHDSNVDVSFYISDDTLIDTVTSDSNGDAVLEWTPEWGTYTVYTYEDNIGETVKNEWLIDTIIIISELSNNVFIDDVSFNNDGEFNINQRTIITLNDLNGLLTDLEFTDDLKYNMVYSELQGYSDDELTGTDLTPKDYSILQQAITDIIVEDNGDVKIQRNEEEII
ncbi:MAG: hypothetical protein IJH63_00410 [Methanobrevibacter sp.]|nr:hypothetical protein [Methanosphaera sp.]MBR0369165.1 hypothetical protein [Methanobrevibacter sp.]